MKKHAATVMRNWRTPHLSSQRLERYNDRNDEKKKIHIF